MACGALLAGGVCVAWTPSAFAYIDAGTASMLFQLLIAGILGGLLTLKMFWARVKEFFRSFGRKGAADDR